MTARFLPVAVCLAALATPAAAVDPAGDKVVNGFEADKSLADRTRDAVLQELIDRNGPGGPGRDGLVVRFDDDGVVYSLGGIDVAPGCTLTEALTEASARRLADCFLRRSGVLFSGGEALIDGGGVLVTRAVQPVREAAAIELRQGLRGIPIGTSMVTLGVIDGSIRRASGRFVPVDELPSPKSAWLHSDGEASEARAEQLVGSDLVAQARYIDLQLEAIVTEFRKARTDGLILRFDERRGTVADVYFAADHGFVRRTAPRLTYGSSAATPYRIFRDPATDAAVVTLDHISFEETGPCDDASGWMPAVVNHHALDMEGGANLGFAADVACAGFLVGPPPTAGIPLVEDLDSPEFAAGNVAFWFEDLATFATDVSAGYHGAIPWSGSRPRILNVHVLQQLGDVWAAVAVPIQSETDSRTEIYLPDNIEQPGGNQSSLVTLAHEYGHHVAYSYGYSSHYGGGRRVTEGWADHNVLRYLVYRFEHLASRPHDAFPNGTPSYDAWLSSVGPQHETVLIAGEHVPGGRLAMYPDKDPPYVDRRLIFDSSCDAGPYECSLPMSAVYWEVAWNELRSPFLDWGTGTPIEAGPACPGGGPLPSGVHHALNRAYTWAIILQPHGNGVDDDVSGLSHVKLFFDNVWAFLDPVTSGPECVLSEASRERIREVMAHHCVGPWDGYCDPSLYVILPGSPYALTASGHASFDNEQTHLVAAIDMTASGAASKDEMLPDGGATLTLNPMGEATFTVDTSGAGLGTADEPFAFYDLFLVVQGDPNARPTFEIYVNDVLQTHEVGGVSHSQWWVESATADHFVWTPLGWEVRLDGNAVSTIKLRNVGNWPALLRAARLELTCTPRTAAQCGPTECGVVDDNCGHAVVDCGVCDPVADLGLLDCGGPELVDPALDPNHCGGCNSPCPELCHAGGCRDRLDSETRVGLSAFGGPDSVTDAAWFENAGLAGFHYRFVGGARDFSTLTAGTLLVSGAPAAPTVFEVGFHDPNEGEAYTWQYRRQELPLETTVDQIDECNVLPTLWNQPVAIAAPPDTVQVLLGFELRTEAPALPIQRLRVELRREAGGAVFRHAFDDGRSVQRYCYRLTIGHVPEALVASIGQVSGVSPGGPHLETIDALQPALRGFDFEFLDGAQHLREVRAQLRPNEAVAHLNSGSGHRFRYVLRYADLR